MSQLDFTLFVIHYLDVVTVFYFFISAIVFVLVGRRVSGGGRKKG